MMHKEAKPCWSLRRRSRFLLLVVLSVAGLVLVQVVYRKEDSFHTFIPTRLQSYVKEAVLTVYHVPHFRNGSELSWLVQEEHVNVSSPPHTAAPNVIHTTTSSNGPVERQTWEDLKARKQHVEEICQTLDKKRPERMNGIFLNDATKLAYCYVPKTGCTFWKRVFGWLNQNVGPQFRHVKSPFSIPRLHIHLARGAYGIKWKTAKNRVLSKLRFMFSRDPYSRLWSTYLDKLYLPDFWRQDGVPVVSRRSPNASAHDLKCGSSVEFPEFVNYSLGRWEPHIDPVSQSCDPCLFKPDVLGKMETYTRDAKAVLEHANLTWILDGVDMHQHMLQEVDMLISYNFQVVLFKVPWVYKEKCITESELAQRLWKTFQYNGYISNKISLKLPEPFEQKTFTQAALAAVNMSLTAEYGGKDALKLQKRQAMESAFKQVPRVLLEGVAKKYDLDFKMFGYKPRFLD